MIFSEATEIIESYRRYIHMIFLIDTCLQKYDLKSNLPNISLIIYAQLLLFLQKYIFRFICHQVYKVPKEEHFCAWGNQQENPDANHRTLTKRIIRPL